MKDEVVEVFVRKFTAALEQNPDPIETFRQMMGEMLEEGMKQQQEQYGIAKEAKLRPKIESILILKGKFNTPEIEFRLGKSKLLEIVCGRLENQQFNHCDLKINLFEMDPDSVKYYEYLQLFQDATNRDNNLIDARTLQIRARCIAAGSSEKQLVKMIRDYPETMPKIIPFDFE